jgi:hypothetical protein
LKGVPALLSRARIAAAARLQREGPPSTYIQSSIVGFGFRRLRTGACSG